MSDIFPIQSERNVNLENPAVVDLASDESEVYLDALSSKTTRKVFVELYDSPSTISGLSDELDDSIQNTKYHVEKLQESDLIEEVGNDYSERGNEMSVYAPTNEAVVLLVGSSDTKRRIRESVKKAGSFVVPAGITALLFAGWARVQSTATNDELQTLSKSDDENSVGIATETEDAKNGTMIESASDTGSDVTTEIAFGPVSLPPSVAILTVFFVSIAFGAVVYYLLRR